MTLPGQIGHAMPPSTNDLARRIRNLERTVMMLMGEIAQAQSTANTAIADAQAAATTAQSTATAAQTAATSAQTSATAAAGIVEGIQCLEWNNTAAYAPQFGVWSEVATGSVTVPSGMTRLLYVLSGYVTCINTTAADDSLAMFVSANYSAMASESYAATAAPGQYACASTSTSGTLTGLSAGAVINLYVSAETTVANWPMSGDPTANAGTLTLLAIWLP